MHLDTSLLLCDSTAKVNEKKNTKKKFKCIFKGIQKRHKHTTNFDSLFVLFVRHRTNPQSIQLIKKRYDQIEKKNAIHKKEGEKNRQPK